MLAGNIFVYSNQGFVYVKAENAGDAAILTHNLFETEEQSRTAKNHDDHLAAVLEGSGEVNVETGRVIEAYCQHGVAVAPGTPDDPAYAAYRLHFGLSYGQFNPLGPVIVGPDKWLRVGFRGKAWGVVAIPREGEVKVIPYNELAFYGDTAGERLEPKLKGAPGRDVAALMLAARGASE